MRPSLSSIENGAQLLRQGGKLEGLLQKQRVGPKLFYSDDAIGISGHQNDLGGGMRFLQAESHFRAANSRHYQIGQDYVDLPRVFERESKSLGRIWTFQNGVAYRFEELLGDGAQTSLVFNQKDGF